MNKHKLLLVFICFSFLCHSQERWRDLFSYNNVSQIIVKDNVLLCFSENGYFTYDEITGELHKFSKVQGLNGVDITATAYNATYDYLFISYETGSFNILTPDGIEYFVDIPIDEDYQGSKAVNHIYTVGDKAVFSMDFGVLIFDLPGLEFDETTYFNNTANNGYYVVNESIILNNKVYSATENGMYSHEITDLIPNFLAWDHSLNNQAINHIETLNNTIIIGDNLGNIYTSTNGVNWSSKGNYNYLVDITINESKFIITQNYSSLVFSSNFTLENSFNFPVPINSSIYQNGVFYGASVFNGVLNSQTDEEIIPDGPLLNRAKHITVWEDFIFIAPDGQDPNFNAPTGLENGFFYFDGMQWNHKPKEELGDVKDIIHVVVDPSNPDKIHAASYGSGVVELQDFNFNTIYNQSNSSIKPLPRMVGIDFDSENNMVISQTFAVTNGIEHNAMVLKTPDNQWAYFDLLPHRLEYAPSIGYPFIDSKDWIWVGSFRQGDPVIAYNMNDTPTNTSDDIVYTLTNLEGNGNLPDNSAGVIAEDKSGNIWIGSRSGVRVLTNPQSSLESGNYNTSIVVVEQNGLAEEFLRDTNIYDIAIDEANRKWFATNAGVFYLDASNDFLINAFNTSNSPLPINTVYDIEIDPNTGWVYFATTKGAVAYLSDVSKADDSFGEVVPYPNPVRPGNYNDITIKGLANNAKVKITDITGNLIFEGTARGGVITWNQKNLRGNYVASGIYLVLMTNQDNTETKTTKIAIVR